MLSWRLWQSLAEPASQNPIFTFVRDQRKPRPKEAVKTSNVWRVLGILTLLVLIIGVIRVPEMLIYVFQVPILAVTLMVVSPLFLPLGAIIAGGYLVNKITSGIHKEKRQFTYELLCASPEGALHANWSFASGLLHRHGWFQWMKSMTIVTFRVGRIITVLVAVLVGVLLLAGDEGVGFTQVHLAVSLVLFVGLFYTNLQQSIALSMTVGLYTSSLDISRRDASIVGLLTYTLWQLMAFLTALVIFILLSITLPADNPIAQIIITTLSLSSIYLTREFAVMLMWQALKRSLNSTTDNTEVIMPDTSLRPSIFTAT